MTYQTIMRKITSGLTGEAEHDFAYLQEQSKKYSKHKLAREILRGIGRIITEILPQEEKEKFSKAFANNALGWATTIEEAEFLINKREYEKAFSMIDPIVRAYNAADTGAFSDDGVNEYHYFSNPFEYVLYLALFKPQKEVRRMPLNFVRPLQLHGFLLLEFGRYEEARASLRKARKINPVRVDILFEFAETYKIENKFEDYLELTKQCFKYAYTKKDLARCYRNIGYYCIEKADYETAVAVETYSLFFEKSTMVQSELFYISQKTGKLSAPPSVEVMQQLLRNIDIPLGPSQEVLGIAYSLAKDAEEKQNYDIAKFSYGILYELTGNDDIKAKLESLIAISGDKGEE
jgi:tetratricopeptide (TPR) repeat protein